ARALPCRDGRAPAHPRPGRAVVRARAGSGLCRGDRCRADELRAGDGPSRGRAGQVVDPVREAGGPSAPQVSDLYDLRRRSDHAEVTRPARAGIMGGLLGRGLTVKGAAMTQSAARTQVFVGAGTWTSQRKHGGLFRRVVGNGGWESLTKGLPSPVSVQAITIHPDDAGLIYVGTQDGPYRSRDGGASWERGDFPAGLQVWSLSVHPHRPRVLYAGTS